MSKILQVRSLFLLAILVVGACSSPPKVRIDKDASVNLAGYKTFSWFEPAATPAAPAESSKDAKSPAPKPIDSLVESRMHGAIASVLQSKGYTLSDASPDFRVSYLINVYERPKESGMRLGLGAGGGSGNVGGAVGMSIPIGKRTETVAALTIDIIDPSRNAQVWTASYQTTIKGPTLSDADAQSLVAAVLEKYPAR